MVSDVSCTSIALNRFVRNFRKSDVSMEGTSYPISSIAA